MKHIEKLKPIWIEVKRFSRKMLTMAAAAAVFGFVFVAIIDYRIWLNDYYSLDFEQADVVSSAQPPLFSGLDPTASDGVGTENKNLVFEDTFDGDTLDLTVWNAVNQYWTENGEAQKYLQNQVDVSYGSLNLTAVRNSNGGYESGKVDTKGKLELVYGKVEVSMRLCEGKGLFPAIWLLYQDPETNTYVEIDIMENLGHESETVFGVLHMTTNEGYTYDYSTFYVENPLGFHLYSVEWTESYIVWYVDGNEYLRVVASIPPVPLHLIINLAVGGDWPGEPDCSTVFPTNVEVDYVKFYSSGG